MKNTKKILSLLMAMLIFCQGLVLVSAVESSEGSAEAVEWTYDNSMLVKINTEEAKIFTPEDFPDMNCIQVLTTEKQRTETGYSYELMLIFDTTDGFDWQTTADALLATYEITDIRRNVYSSDYHSNEQVCIINETELNLRVGESADLYVELVKLETFWPNFSFEGVLFVIDPEIIDESTLRSDSFADYGVEEFFPCESYYQSWTPEFGIDKYHEYVCLLDDVRSSMEIIEKFSTVEGLQTVSTFFKDTPTGEPYGEYWTVEDESVASLALSGGDNGGYFFTYTPLNQTATVTGLSEGTTTVTVERRGSGAEESAVCTVTVCADGDVNTDGVINSLDAAILLKYDANLIDETQLTMDNADMNSDGVVNSLDAAFILRYDAGLE